MRPQAVLFVLALLPLACEAKPAGADETVKGGLGAQPMSPKLSPKAKANQQLVAPKQAPGTKGLVGEDGKKGIIGEDGSKALIGEDANKALIGEDANKALIGEDGSKALIGEDGSKALIGEDGSKALIGEEGKQIVAPTQ